MKGNVRIFIRSFEILINATEVFNYNVKPHSTLRDCLQISLLTLIEFTLIKSVSVPPDIIRKPGFLMVSEEKKLIHLNSLNIRTEIW